MTTARNLKLSRFALLRFFIFSYSLLLGQDAFSQNFAINAQVVEDDTGAPIPYASVYTLRNRRGTITDMSGSFEMTELSATDTLVFYFAGFEKLQLPAAEIGTKVRLPKLEQLLDDVIVMADESLVYKLIANTPNFSGKNEIAQSYLEVQSWLGDHQLEYFQGYFNGQYDGYDIDDLQLKTSRFGIQETPEMAFMSLEVSEAFYKHDFFKSTELFPDSPFGMGRRKLIRKFSLTMNAKYKEENGDITYVVSFQPRRDTASAFYGKAWIDSASNILTKVQFNIENASKFPFTPIHRGGKLENMNMHITKSYERTSDGVRLQTNDFDYDFVFDSQMYYDLDSGFLYTKKPLDSTKRFGRIPKYEIRAETLLAAYDYDNQFFIPRFEFPDEFADYRKMIAFEDHPEFWSCYDAFRVGRSEEKEQFLNDPRTIDHRAFHKPTRVSNVGMYEFPYRVWDEKRVYLRAHQDSAKNEPNSNPFEGNSINANKYNLKAQILFEIDSLCDTMRYRTKTIFDPFQSFYNFERTPRSVAFHNVYFDLMEIYRRQLVAKLDAVENPTVGIWTDIYENHMITVDRNIQRFFKEVERGTREEAFLKWNAFVLEELKIDNNALFANPDDQEGS